MSSVLVEEFGYNSGLFYKRQEFGVGDLVYTTYLMPTIGLWKVHSATKLTENTVDLFRGSYPQAAVGDVVLELADPGEDMPRFSVLPKFHSVATPFRDEQLINTIAESVIEDLARGIVTKYQAQTLG